VFYLKSSLHAVTAFAKDVLTGAAVFCVIAGLALLLDYLTPIASTHATGFLAVIIGATQYSLLTVDVAWLVVILVRASIRLWKEVASDPVWEAKHD
jgi:hypothetical protein